MINKRAASSPPLTLMSVYCLKGQNSFDGEIKRKKKEAFRLQSFQQYTSLQSVQKFVSSLVLYTTHQSHYLIRNVLSESKIKRRSVQNVELQLLACSYTNLLPFTYQCLIGPFTFFTCPHPSTAFKDELHCNKIGGDSQY